VGAELAPLTATVSLNSDPENATVWIDGRDTGRMTPAQISVDKPGDHTFVFKKQGYLDETTTANLQIGQKFLLAPSLRVLGRTDEIKMVGKFRKLFGGEKAGMGIVSVNTQPKGAQIAVNNHIINKPSPAKFYLNPGNYVIDITRPGLKSIHRVVSVGQRSKVVIDEVMAHK
jgi:PEGA domain